MLAAEIKSRQAEQPVIFDQYEKILPTYFNSGCCCFSDGDITGIEIADGYIRLIKWEIDGSSFVKIVLEEKAFDALEIVYA